MSAQITQDFLTTKEIFRTVFNAVKPIQPYAKSYEKNTRKPNCNTINLPPTLALTDTHTHPYPPNNPYCHPPEALPLTPVDDGKRSTISCLMFESQHTAKLHTVLLGIYLHKQDLSF